MGASKPEEQLDTPAEKYVGFIDYCDQDMAAKRHERGLAAIDRVNGSAPA